MTNFSNARTTTTDAIHPLDDLQRLVQADLDGIATAIDRTVLSTYQTEWVSTLRSLRRRLDGTIGRLERELAGPERDLVLEDFYAERGRLDNTLTTLTGEHPDVVTKPRSQAKEPVAPSTVDALQFADSPQLQLCVTPEGIAAFSAAANGASDPIETLRERLTAAGAPTQGWQDGPAIALPVGEAAPSITAPISHTLGWLASLDDTLDDVGVSVRWLARAARYGVRVVAQGRMVPQLEKVGDASGNRSEFAVRWVPALLDATDFEPLVRAMPGAISALDSKRDPHIVTERIVTLFVDAICREAASRIDVPAPPPHPQRPAEIAENMLARLNGSHFDAPHQQGSDLRRAVRSWASSVTGPTEITLTVALGPPDDTQGWLLRTITVDGKYADAPVEAAMSRAKHERKEQLKAALQRLETLYPPLTRSKESRRGQVLLSQDEAWMLMTRDGPRLLAAGFGVKVPPLAKKKASGSLKITSLASSETAVGAQQLNDVRWSAVFDDVELTAAQIAELAQQSRPLLKSKGTWIELDHADLNAAAKALADQEQHAQLSGADMLRFALGLEDLPFGSHVSLGGGGWAAELFAAAANVHGQTITTPQGFSGELRAYQADAVGWLRFLDQAGLGGCLALDMGLGKTPTMLAHLADTTADAPALVIAPPAVVGNWAAEAAKFTPHQAVAVHHGANRAERDTFVASIKGANVVITTYGTAVRDIAMLEQHTWSRIVLDEAQVIKNPTSETALQLRRLNARSRIVLTGTPIENGLGDLWALMDFVNPGLLGDRASFVAQMQATVDNEQSAESALKTLNGVLVFRRTKAEPVIAQELPDRIDSLDHCPMTPEQIGLYQAVLDKLVIDAAQRSLGEAGSGRGDVLAAITALKQICNHPAAYTGDDAPLSGRSGKLARLEEIVENVFAADERLLIFTHFATWGTRLADHLSTLTGTTIPSYHGGLSRSARDQIVDDFQSGTGPGALVLSLKAGGTGLNLTAASHVVLYDRWWNPAVEDQARDRVWRIGQTKTVVAHRLICPGTVDERVEEVVSGKRRIADIVLPKSSSIDDLDTDQLKRALGMDPNALLTDEPVAVLQGSRR